MFFLIGEDWLIALSDTSDSVFLLASFVEEKSRSISGTSCELFEEEPEMLDVDIKEVPDPFPEAPDSIEWEILKGWSFSSFDLYLPRTASTGFVLRLRLSVLAPSEQTFPRLEDEYCFEEE